MVLLDEVELTRVIVENEVGVDEGAEEKLDALFGRHW